MNARQQCQAPFRHAFKIYAFRLFCSIGHLLVAIYRLALPSFRSASSQKGTGCNRDSSAQSKRCLGDLMRPRSIGAQWHDEYLRIVRFKVDHPSSAVWTRPKRSRLT